MLIDAIQDRAWALLPSKLDEINTFLLARLNDEGVRDLAAAIEKGKSGARADDLPYQNIDGVAIIDVFGTLSKRMNMMSALSGGTSTEILQRNIGRALNDPQVQAIILDIESPGGSVDGTTALADFIFNSRGKKPIIAFANGLMASAAYWIGSAADMVIATETAVVGSIGVVMTHYDRSAQDAADGVKRTEIYAGQYKRIATDAKPLSQDGAAYLQGMVDDLYSVFVNAVARNRGVTIDQALAMADGRTFIGEKARAIGLVDMIGNKSLAFAKAIERSNLPMDIKVLQEKHPELFAQVKDLGKQDAMQVMAAAEAKAKETGINEERARVVEILSAKADAEATTAAIKDGIPAQTAYKSFFEAERKMRGEALKKLVADAPDSAGQEPPTADAGDNFEAKVAKLVASGKSRSDAISAAIAEHPALYEQHIARINGGKKGA